MTAATERLVVVSNRVPSARERTQPAGGLTVGLHDALRGRRSLWFGWSGRTRRRAAAQRPRLEESADVTYATIDLTPAQEQRYYENFSNALLWPLCHYRPGIIDFHREDLAAYHEVNALFADRLAVLLKPGDTIWVHDYHLFPLGQALRGRGVTGRIGFFLHIPFPPWSLARLLPCAEELLHAMTAYDLIGVQTEEDARNLTESLGRCGLRKRAEVFPIGIDPAAFARHAEESADAPELRRLGESLRGRRLVIGVDRLDYSKGPAERLRGYEALLRRHPEHRGRVVYLQVSPLSRTGIRSYQILRREMDELAGRINGQYGDFDWMPVRYLTRPISRPILAGFHRLADAALVTPLRDGMNLVAKEFVAAQKEENPGVLVLSHFAGAAPRMADALLVNPYDPDEIADALHTALTMPAEERHRRWRALIADVRRNTAAHWAKRFLARLNAAS